MDSKKLKQYISLGLLVVMTGGLVACAKKSSSNKNPTINPIPVDTGGGTDELTRRCRIPVRFTNADAHEEALEALVQARVNRRERPTTMCVAAPTTPTKNFPASLRFEYEDNFGLRWVTFRKQDLVYSKQGSSEFRLLYLDMYGYVELKTTRNSAGKFAGSVRVANINYEDSYLQEIEDFLDLIKTTCMEYPAKCLNPIFYTDPNAGRPPTEAEILQRANDAFAGKHGAESHTLGTVTFDAGDIEGTLF
jgi:hypothetical protein